MANTNMIAIDDTRFMFKTNFAGDPSRDSNGDSRRKCCIIIPDPRQAEELSEMGFLVKKSRPGPDDNSDDFVPEYYVQCILSYRDKHGKPKKYPPKVYLVNDSGVPRPMYEDTVKELDDIRVRNVNVILSPWEYEPGKFSLYIRTMYVEQDVENDPYIDPYASRYNWGRDE